MMHYTNKERERERERVESQLIKRKQQDVFRGSSTELYVPAFTEKDFQSTRSPELLSQPIQPKSPHWEGYKHNPPLPKRDTNLTPTPHHQEGVNHNLNLYQRGSTQQSKSTSTKEGYNQIKGWQLGGLTTTNNSFFHKTSDSIERIEW